MEGEIKAEVNWSIESATRQTTVTRNTNSSSTGITLTIPSSPGDKAYTFSTAVYNTANTGTLKVAHAVDPYGSTQGESWWLKQYGRKPDPALNLPFRIIQNDDGSYDIYFGPIAPKGKEGNWVQTVPGKGWNTIFRLYGPLESWFDQTWRPGEIELLNYARSDVN